MTQVEHLPKLSKIGFYVLEDLKLLLQMPRE